MGAIKVCPKITTLHPAAKLGPKIDPKMDSPIFSDIFTWTTSKHFIYSYFINSIY